MYSYSKLVRMGNYWSRTVLCIPHVLSEKLIVKYKPVPEHVRRSRDLIIDIFFPPVQACICTFKHMVCVISIRVQRTALLFRICIPHIYAIVRQSGFAVPGEKQR
jgi:hypothetical protein